MQNGLFYQLFLTAAFALMGPPLGLNPRAFAQDEEPNGQKGVEVLTRGPVHEAFAEVVSFTPEPGAVVPKAPPDPIEELPPEQKPEGPNVAWIPGYWTWDDDRDDFLWVSGVWRSLPPGRQWVPGYWTSTDQGSQWISGYWADAQTTAVEYLPEPPQTIEEGPNVEPDSPDAVWIPGAWVWYDGRYAWRPGHWVAGRPDWMWVPSYYVWSPRGYVFVNGYWDYAIARRGLLFAPVYFDAGVYGQPGFSYAPSVVINLAVFNDFLFLRPTFGHYYFGDYFGGSYANAGFYPWFAFSSQYRSGYDPIFAAQRWQHRDDRNWEENLHTQFDRRRENEGARPPRTFAEQSQPGGAFEKAAGAALIAAPLAKLASSKASDLRLAPVNKQERTEIAKAAQQVHTFAKERHQLETGEGKAEKRTGREAEPGRVKFPASPIVASPARPGEGFEKGHVPPELPKHPKPDTTVEPGTPRGRDVGKPQNTEPGTRNGVPGRERPGAEPGVKPGEGAPKGKKVQPFPESPKAQPIPKKPEPQKPEPRPEPPKPKKVEPRPAPPPKAAPPRQEQPKGPPVNIEPKKNPAPPSKAVPPKPEQPKGPPPNVGPKKNPGPPPKAAPPRQEQPKGPPPNAGPKKNPGPPPKAVPPKPEPPKGPPPNAGPKKNPGPPPKGEPKDKPKVG